MQKPTPIEKLNSSMPVEEQQTVENSLGNNTFKGNNAPTSYEETVAKQQNPNGITEEIINDKGEKEMVTREATAKDAKMNTGTGAEAALGTKYSWETAGTEKAQTQFKADVNTAKTNAQENASTINQQLVTNQESADMIKYQNNQEAEKVGWTGGYVLDQNRQADYLKASIATQMYGAIELQKYGYDTSLAAARLSYDLNQQEYAKQYYQDAVTNALNEAQITGTYFSAETKDMMAQYAIAEQKLKDDTLSDADKESATKIMKNITDWYSANGISQEGVKTLAAWQADQNNELGWQNEIWMEYQAALQTAQAAIDDNATAFIRYNADGIEYKNGEVQTIDMSGLNTTELMNYANTSTKAKEQVTAYLEYLKNEALASGTVYDSEGNIINYKTADIKTKLDSLLEKAKTIGIDIDVSSLTGKGLEIRTDANGKSEVIVTGGTASNGMQQGTSAVFNADGTVQTPGTSMKLFSGDTGIAKQFSIDKFTKSRTDDDLDIDIGNGVIIYGADGTVKATGTKTKNYDVDVDWGVNGAGANKNNFNQEEWDSIQKTLNAAYPNSPTDTLVIYTDPYNNQTNVWIYKVVGNEAKWGYIQNASGGKKLLDDLLEYQKGVLPKRWKK